MRRVRGCKESEEDELASELEVVNKLGSGSYAVVYLVREVLHEPVDDDEDYFGGRLDFDDFGRTVSGRGKRVTDLWRSDKKKATAVVANGSSRKTTRALYGREFAVKVLSKQNLDEDGRT